MKFLNIKDEILFLKQKQKIEWELENYLLSKNCLKIEPSFFEDYDEFTTYNKRIKRESMVKVLNGYNRVSILRPDITTSIIRSLILRWEKGLKLKVFYNSTVFENTLNSNIKENKHIGIEYLGDYKGDCEVISLALEILKKYNNNFILEVGTSNYINSLFEEINIEEKYKKKLKGLIYSKNQFELGNLINRLDIDKDIKRLLDNILDMQGDFNTVIAKAKKFYMNKAMEKSLNEIELINSFIENSGYSENVHFDLAMIGEFDYYEGVIFKGYYPNVYNSILNGGRYDSLTEMLGMRIPAIGFSIKSNEFIKQIITRGD